MLNKKLSKQIFQTYNGCPSKDPAIDIEGRQGHTTLHSSDFSKL